MALINCPECGEKISDKAIMCPKCGYSTRSNMMGINLWLGFEWKSKGFKSDRIFQQFLTLKIKKK